MNDFRVAAIVALAQNTKARLGKTQLQKLVYFAQQSGIPLQYKYQIYHYGPYSFELSHDLSSLDGLGVLNIESDPKGFGFGISAGKFADKFRLDTKNQKKLDKVIDQFGFSSVAELEVKSTIHFVQCVLEKRSSSKNTRTEVLEKVHALKPKFSRDFIKSCYTDLRRTNWI